MSGNVTDKGKTDTRPGPSAEFWEDTTPPPRRRASEEFWETDED